MLVGGGGAVVHKALRNGMENSLSRCWPAGSQPHPEPAKIGLRGVGAKQGAGTENQYKHSSGCGVCRAQFQGQEGGAEAARTADSYSAGFPVCQLAGEGVGVRLQGNNGARAL